MIMVNELRFLNVVWILCRQILVFYIESVFLMSLSFTSQNLRTLKTLNFGAQKIQERLNNMN